MDKQQILEEIRRTAQENGGQSLSIAKFHQATGIRVTDWHGKFWARWGDAVREAGYEPNRMTKATDEGEAVEKFISLIRELGRFPVRGELQIKAHADKCFPSYKVFQRRWSKEQLAKKILSYCAERPDYEDVATLCAPIAAQDVSSTEDTRTDDTVSSDATTKRGFVYLKVMKIRALP